MSSIKTPVVPDTIFTHDGIFHADEVSAVAVIQVLNPNLMVIRTRDNKKLENAGNDPHAILVDVGGQYDPEKGLYDHHQKEGAGNRHSSHPYSSLGLIWLHYGHQCIALLHPDLTPDQVDAAWQDLDDGMISAVDAVDCNGMRIYKDAKAPVFTFTQVISGFNRGSGHDFDAATNLAGVVISNEISSAVVKVKKRVSLLLDMENQKGSHILVFSDFFPGWSDSVKGSDFQRVVFQDVSGTWRVQITPDTPSLPEAWLGLSGADFSAVTGVPGGIFCHRGGFIAGHATMDGAIELAKASLC